MSTEDIFKDIDTKEKFDNKFPDMKFLPQASFPDFIKFSENKNALVLHLAVHAAQILNKTSTFQDQMKLLIIDKVFMSCQLLVTLKRTSRFTVKWTSNSNMFTAMGISLTSFLKYI